MKINTVKITDNYLVQNKTLTHNLMSPLQVFTGSDATSISSGYYRGIFEANQNMSKISFCGIPAEIKMEQLKGNLKKICEETIHHYNQHDEAISQNLFTRGYVHHCFDFVQIEGDDLYNTNDPFGTSEWGAYIHSKNKTTVDGSNLSSFYSKKMRNKINSWMQKFIQIISQEKTEGKNSLLDDLLANGNDIQKVKELLGFGNKKP